MRSCAEYRVYNDVAISLGLDNDMLLNSEHMVDDRILITLGPK